MEVGEPKTLAPCGGTGEDSGHRGQFGPCGFGGRGKGLW